VWGDAATRTEYVWEGERPVFAIKDAFAGALGPADAARSRTRYAYDYDEQGLARIPYKVEDVASGEVLATGLQWIRSSPDAFAAARALVVAELPARILAWATRVAPFEPVAALALIVSADEAELPPRLALGTVAELRAINAQHGGQERHDWHAFSTMGFECWDPEPEELCGDVAFDDACALLVQEWWRVRELDASLELLRDVVRRLQRLDWSEALRPSAIYVTVDDLSDEDALEHVQATVSAEIIDALKALTT
jgi:hypothetical protein